MTRTTMRPAVRAVTFDFWDTIVAATEGSGTGMRRLQTERFARTLADAGHPVSADELVEAFEANWARFEERWLANTGQYTPADSVGFIAERVGVELTDDLRDALIDGFRQVGEDVGLQMGAGIEESLATLQAAGVRLGIVCDVGLTSAPTLRRRLEELGLLHMFDAWAFSDETGWFKPSARAFEPALAGLGIDDPAVAAHVGDNRRTDVAGALALGMIAVRFTGFHDRSPETGPEADHVIDDHRKLPALLGVA
ncbi:MAG: HAD family hydrolase [Actinomycetota bacterium]|nr:HAD family hydrolase [Actinomycetota bacterium]MDH5224826.1 HAD family hydrolase [Actinomycetota bacterium]MDH5313185.1 HAD family hydrolase [Actinomycetota bacterium]